MVRSRGYRRWLPGALLCLLPVLSLGCSNSEQSAGNPVSLPFDGQTIGIAVPSGLGLADSWRLILEEWSVQTGAEYRIAEYDSLESLDDAGSTNLLVFPMTEFAALTAAGRLTSIPRDEWSSDGWMDLFLGLRENVASINRQPTAVPVSSPVLVLYYRRDLLEAAELSPPQTWGDYQKLLETLDRWAPGLTAVEPWHEEFRATMFLSRAAAFAKHPANYSVFFDIDTGEPLIDGPGFVAALEAAQAALSKMPSEVLNFTPADCRRELLAGRAALAVALETAPDLQANLTEATLTSAEQRPEAAQIGIRRLPGTRQVYNRSMRAWESSPLGPVNYANLTAFSGLCAGISSSSTPEQAQAVWNLLTVLTADYMTAAFPVQVRSLCRKSQTGSAMAWIGNDLTAGEKMQYVAAVTQSLENTQVVAELPVVGRYEFRAALTEGLARVLAGDDTPQDALSAIADNWKEIANKLGADEVKASYQRSLGLGSFGTK
jgi:ABC-type glycerol-3-phosphate transport system substrate-binding protein